jgi:protein SPT2
MEQLSREARARELMAANAKLVSGPGAGAKVGGAKDEYDPFAEDERRPASASVAGSSKLSSTKGKQSGGARTSNGHGNGNGNGHGNGVKAPKDPRDPSKERTRNREDRGGSPPALGRKEKAARAFAQKAKRGGVADSVFSVRALVESREARGGSSPAHAAPGSMSPARIPVSHAHTHGFINGTGGGGGGGGGARKTGSRKKEIVGDLLKLCPERETRDRRTIDEIHRDIKVRKGILPSTVDRERERPLEGRAASSRTASASASPAKAPAISRPKPSKPPPIPSTARPSAATTSASRLPAPSRSANGHDQSQHRGQSQTHRGCGRSSSPSTSSSSTSTSPPRKRPRPGPGRSPSLDPFDVSATIQSMFRRPGAAARRYDDVESEGSSDMEAGLSDVEAEEERARRIARREDEQAEREEREHRLMKERKKREVERLRAKGR